MIAGMSKLFAALLIMLERPT